MRVERTPVIQSSWTISCVMDRLHGAWRSSADVWSPAQLSWEAARVPAEVTQTATRWDRCLNMAKHLDIKSYWPATFYLLLVSSFPTAFFGKLDRYLMAMACICRHTGLVWPYYHYGVWVSCYETRYSPPKVIWAIAYTDLSLLGL